MVKGKTREVRGGIGIERKGRKRSGIEKMERKREEKGVVVTERAWEVRGS